MAFAAFLALCRLLSSFISKKWGFMCAFLDKASRFFITSSVAESIRLYALSMTLHYPENTMSKNGKIMTLGMSPDVFSSPNEAQKALL